MSSIALSLRSSLRHATGSSLLSSSSSSCKSSSRLRSSRSGGDAGGFSGRGGGDRDSNRPNAPSRQQGGGRDRRPPYAGDSRGASEAAGLSEKKYGRAYEGDPRYGLEPVYGFYDGDHIYGITPVLAALQAGKRNISELMLQQGLDASNKKDEKGATDIVRLAKERGVRVSEYSKHDLNMLTDNKVHQGFVLRAAPLEFARMVGGMEPSSEYRCVLALDEVWDPQNFGALLRTSLFLGVDKVVVCAKNSAPLSPAVSKASAGAMEVMEVASTDNMMRFLDRSAENGWNVVGTALSSDAIALSQAPLDKPTIVVLGNEGHGVRTNVLRRCTHLVKIAPGYASSGADADSNYGAVDSLNVSVTGGILLHHFLLNRRGGE